MFAVTGGQCTTNSRQVNKKNDLLKFTCTSAARQRSLSHLT